MNANIQAPFSFAPSGAELFAGAAVAALPTLETLCAAEVPRGPGVRISNVASMRPLLAAEGLIGRVAAKALGADCRPVRAILFDKTAETNWSLGWHQDRTICVRERIDTIGYGPWTVKQGLIHVAPPFSLLERMVTLRVHIDDVPADNAPLLIAPGSHRFGLVPEAEVEAVVHNCGMGQCLARAGDVWLYATLILHASRAASRPGHRRVLQIDYAAEALPGRLEWLGV